MLVATDLRADKVSPRILTGRLLAQSGHFETQRPVTEKGCDTIQPFRAMSPPNLRLKSGWSSRVRSAALVWLVLRHVGVDEAGRFWCGDRK